MAGKKGTFVHHTMQGNFVTDCEVVKEGPGMLTVVYFDHGMNEECVMELHKDQFSPKKAVPPIPPLIKVLADWEDANGTIAAITAKEWVDLREAVQNAACRQSPRMLRQAFKDGSLYAK
jgi:hypothetical protein